MCSTLPGLGKREFGVAENRLYSLDEAPLASEKMGRAWFVSPWTIVAEKTMIFFHKFMKHINIEKGKLLKAI